MGTVARQRLVNEGDYLEGERTSDVRHEYVDGVLFAMGGASREHALIATNLVAVIRPHLRGSGCRIVSSDMKVRLAEGSRYYYPDIVVSCSERRDEPDRYTETKPVLLIEVLSPTTAATDRREKLLAYQAMPSVVDYLIVSQEGEVAELFTRLEDGWTHATFASGEPVALASIGLELAMADVFADVFEPD